MAVGIGTRDRQTGAALARNTGRAAAVVVLDQNSNVAASYQCERPVEAILGVIDGT